MVKIIDGKRYDTDKAIFVGDYWNGVGNGDFSHEYSKLYRTKSGNWFLYFRGGPLSKYSRSEGNWQHGTEGIIALSPDQAYDYCEENDLVDEIEKYFPEYIEEA